jgi:predicted dehydrogenase
MSAAVRLSVMGAGLIGKRHIQHILARPEATLASIIDPTPAARDMAETLEIAWFPYFHDIPVGKRPDGVVVSTPNQMHVANGLECIEAGVPALVEKPRRRSCRRADAGRRCRAQRRAPDYRPSPPHNPMIQRAKAEIDSGRLGQLVSVHGMFWLIKLDDYFDPAWRRERGRCC